MPESALLQKHQPIVRKMFVTAGLASLVAAVLCSPTLVGALIAPDGKIESPVTLAELLKLRVALACLGALLLAGRRPLARLFLRFPQVVAATAGVGCALALVGAVELAFVWKASSVATVTFLEASDGRAPTIIPDAALGYKPIPSSEVRARVTSGDATVFDVTYHHDAESRRVVLSPHPAPPDAPVTLFFGCSFTYGVGVEDEDTLPSQFVKHTPGQRALNFGFSGYGPQSMLAVLEDKTRMHQVGQEVGSRRKRLTVIYTFIDHHVKRAVGALSVMKYGEDMPYYELGTDGTPARHGTFATGRSPMTPLLRLLSYSKTLDFLRVDWPARVTDGHLALTSALIARSRDLVARRFPDATFHVVLYPGTTLAPRIAPLLAARGVGVIDYSGKDFGWDPKTMAIPIDLHPSGAGHAYVARHLARDLAPAMATSATH